jgi:hypothetical protein
VSKVKPLVIDDEEHERVHDRVAAVDVAKDAGGGVHSHPVGSVPCCLAVSGLQIGLQNRLLICSSRTRGSHWQPAD